ncbi:MAG: alpha/beta fold hydrolase, partial [Thermoanaerobaculia bacterium]
MQIELAHSTWRWTEKGLGTPVVWIHGFPLSSRVYDAQTSIEGVRHILPDLPGFGDSPAPSAPLSIDDYAGGILAIMDEAGVRSAVVAGLSMGGYIALALARLAMERLCGLILIDTKETPDSEEARQGRMASIEKVEAEGTGPVIDGMLPKMLTEETARGRQETVDEVRTIMESASPEGVKAALRAMAERPDASAVLPRIEVPTLVVVGREDSITPPSDAERMRQAI